MSFDSGMYILSTISFAYALTCLNAPRMSLSYCKVMKVYLRDRVVVHFLKNCLKAMCFYSCYFSTLSTYMLHCALCFLSLYASYVFGFLTLSRGVELIVESKVWLLDIPYLFGICFNIPNGLCMLILPKCSCSFNGSSCY